MLSMMPLIKLLTMVQIKNDQEVAPPAPPKPEAGGDLGKKIAGMAARYRALMSQVQSTDAAILQKVKGWLNAKAADLDTLAQKWIQEQDKESVASVYQSTLNKAQSAADQIQKAYV